MNAAEVVVLATGRAVQTHEISSVYQDGVEGVDSHTAGYQQQVHSRVRGRGVKEEVPTRTHGYPGSDSALRGMGEKERFVINKGKKGMLT